MAHVREVIATMVGPDNATLICSLIAELEALSLHKSEKPDEAHIGLVLAKQSRQALTICLELAHGGVLYKGGLQEEAWLSSLGIPSDVAPPHPEIMELPDDDRRRTLAVNDVRRCLDALGGLSRVLSSVNPSVLLCQLGFLLWEVCRVLQHVHDHLEYDLGFDSDCEDSPLNR